MLPTPQMTPQMPIPLGVRTDTGEAMPPLAVDALEHAYPDIADAATRRQNQTTLGADSDVQDANDLTQTGWAILFASDADPAIQAALGPLIALRQAQVQDGNPFAVYAGADPLKGGVLPNQTAADWAFKHNVSLSAPVDPTIVPYYLLIVGSPERISFEFQANFKLEWLVGRLYFDDVADYARYAAAVVAYESAPWQPMTVKNAAVWMTANPGDVATAMLSGALSASFEDALKPLGHGPKFSLDCFVGAAATKAQLTDIMRGVAPKGRPAVIFTGSHGCECPMTNAAFQLATQGALLTEEWTSGAPVTAAMQFAGTDIPVDHQLAGTFVFMFACFSAGCPATDSYYFNADGSPVPLAPAPMISALAQALLANGALGVIGHVDRAFPYGFVDGYGVSQAQLIRTPLEDLMYGQRAGRAVDSFTNAWSSLAAQMALAAAPATTPGAAPVAPPTFAASVNAHIARDDARNYILLGDPAAQLRVVNPEAV